MYRRDEVLPLDRFPQDMQDRIAEAVAQPKPPPRRIRVGHAEMESRAWWEWHWQRGYDPGLKRRALPPMLRQRVITRDGLVCGICGDPVPLDDVHIDHIVPVKHGGTDVLGNLQVAHSQCNMRKGARI